MSEPLGLGTTIGLICPRQPAACCMTGSPPIGKETLRVWPLRSSPSFKDVVFTRATAGGRTNPAFRQHCTRTFSRGGTIVVVGRDMQCWWLGERRVRRLAEARMFGIGTYPAVRVIGELFRSRGKSCGISAATLRFARIGRLQADRPFSFACLNVSFSLCISLDIIDRFGVGGQGLLEDE